MAAGGVGEARTGAGSSGKSRQHAVLTADAVIPVPLLETSSRATPQVGAEPRGVGGSALTDEK